MNKKKFFSKIYDKFVNSIFRFIFLKVSSKEVAQDLTSETFLKVWQKFQNSEIENLKAFLYKTARNLVIDFYREKGKLNPTSLESLPNLPDPRANLEEKIILDEKIQLVKKALSNLKEDYQEAIILRYVDGLSLKEISEILEKSPSATRVLIHRALLALKKECNKIQGFSSS
jgi:RNA polymerase sigma-70 factor (ECF subfamily)